MDTQLTNNPTPASGQPNDDQGSMLPPVQTDDAAQSDQSQVVPVVPDGQTMPDSHALVPMPEAAADSDLIEKEWVLKAKQIVEKTAEDPFAQSEELGKMKSEYLKKRYNKDIGTA